MDRRHTRRSLLAGIGGTLATVGLAGCSGDPFGRPAPDAERYVVAFHWGFRMLAPDGTVTDRLEVAPDSRVAIHGVNLEPIAEGEDLALPDPVARTVTGNYETWEAASLERIAPQVGRSVPDLQDELDAAESTASTHSVSLRGPNGGLVFDTVLPADAGGPATTTVRLETPGAYDFECKLYCGFGHSYMELPGAIVVA